MVAVAAHICLTILLCLSQSQITPSNGFTLPFSSFSSQVLPRRPTNSSVNEVKNLPSVSTSRSNYKSSLGSNCRPPDNELSSSVSRGSVISPLSMPTAKDWSSSGSNPQPFIEGLTPGIIRQQAPAIQPTLSNSLSFTKSYSIPTVPYLTHNVVSNGILPGIRNNIENIPEFVNALGVAPNVATQSTLEPNIPLSTVITAFTVADSNYKSEMSSKFQGTAFPISSFPNTGSSLSTCSQSVNINVGSGQSSETILTQYIPSVLPITNPNSYSLPVVPNTNANAFSTTHRSNTLNSLPNTQQKCLDQTSNIFKSPSFNMLSGNTVPLSLNLIQENNEIIYDAVSSRDSSTLASKISKGFDASSSKIDSNNINLVGKSDFAFKIKPNSIDLKILPVPPSPTEQPLQGCVRPLLRNRNKTSLYSTKSRTVDESNLLISPSMTSLGLPGLNPLSNLQKPQSCIKPVSLNPLYSQRNTSNQVSSALALDKSISSITPVSGVPNLQPYSYMSSTFLPQNLLESHQEVTLSPHSYKHTSETQSRDAANLRPILINPVLPKFCSESIAPVPSSTQSSSSFPSLVTSSLIPSSTLCLNNISTATTTSNVPSVLGINDKISCCSFPIYSSDKICSPEKNKPNIGQSASLSLPPSSTQSISNNYQANKLLSPTVTQPSSQASRIFQMSVDSQCINAPKISPSSQNFFLSNDQSTLTPPQLPIKTGQILTQNHLIPTLAYPNQLPIKQCKEPSICEDTFPINPKISKKLDQSLVKNTPASPSIFPSSTTAYKPVDTYPYAHPIIPSPVIIDTSPDKSPYMPLWLTLLAQKIRASKSNTFSPCAPLGMPSLNCSMISTHTPLNSKCQTSPISYCPSADPCSTFPLNNNLPLNNPDLNTLSLPTRGNGCDICIDIPCSSVLPPKPLKDPLVFNNEDCYIGNSAVSFNGQSQNTYSFNYGEIPNFATLNCLPINHVSPKADKAFTSNPFDSLFPPATNSVMSPVSCLSPVATPCPVPIRCPDLELQDLRNICSSIALPKIVNNAPNSCKCQPSIHTLPDTPGVTTLSSANDKLKLDLLASRWRSSNINSPPITLQPLSKQVHSPDDFKSKTSFQSPLPDLRDFSIVSPCPTTTSAPVLPPIKCPDIFLPLDDISLLLQKPFKKILPVLNTPELCPLKTDFDEFQINRFCTANIPITPTIPISNLSPKSSTDSFSEYLKTFCVNALETSSIPATVPGNNIESPNLCFNDATSTSYITNKFKGCPVSIASQPSPNLKCCDYCIPSVPAVPPVSISKEKSLKFPKTPICRDSIHQIVDIPIPCYLQIEDQVSSTASCLVNNKNNQFNTMYPFSEMFVPVAALPAVSCDLLDISPVFDLPTSFGHTSGVPQSSSLPEVILLPSRLPSSSLMLPPTSTSQNCFDDRFSLSMLAAPSSIDLNSNIILDQQYIQPKSNFETSSTLPTFLLDYLSVPSLPTKYDLGFPTLGSNEYVILEEVLPPRIDSSFLPTTSFGYQTNVMNTMYPSECFYEITSLPTVSCDLFDAENSILPNSMFSTYPEYLTPSTVFLTNTPSAYNAPVIELLSASDPSTFVSNDISQTQSKSSFINNLTKKLAKALITSAVPNLAALCTKD